MAAVPTWAQVAKKKKPPAFLPTECAVDLEQYAAPQRLPPSSSRYSAFIPLPSGYKQGWAMDIASNIPPSAVGLVPRADVSLLEVCFARQDGQQDFLSTPFVCKHFTVHPVPPAGTPSLFVPIKLMNVPVLASLVLEQQLRKHWSAYGDVIAIAPHMYKGLPLQSNRWDMVLKVKAGSPLAAPPFFDLLGFKVMASWPGSEKACPRCKATGHDSHTCPRRPATKKSKKRSPKPNPPPATPSSSKSTIATPATADTADMDEDTPTSDPILFPFELTLEQARDLNNLTPEQWLKHCQTVRSNHPRTEPAIDRFLSLPIEDIVRVFREAVTHLVSAPQPTDPGSVSAPSSSIVTSSSSIDPQVIPYCPFTPTKDRKNLEAFTDEQWLLYAQHLKDNYPRKTPAVDEFLKHSNEAIRASFKDRLASLPPLK